MRLWIISALLVVTNQANAARDFTICLPNSKYEYLNIVALYTQDMGYFKANGLNLKVKYLNKKVAYDFADKEVFLKHPESIDRGVAREVSQANSQCDFGGSTAERMFGMGENMDKVFPLFTAMYGETYDTHLVVATYSHDKDVKSLKGKSVRVGGFPTYLAMLGIIEKNGLKPTDFKIKNDAIGEATLRSLNDGDTDALTAYFPLMALAMAANKVKIVEQDIVRRFVGPRVPHSMLIAKASVVKEFPEAVKAFRLALLQGYKKMTANPHEFFNTRNRHSMDVAGTKKPIKPVLVERAATFLKEVDIVDTLASPQQAHQLDKDLTAFRTVVLGHGYKLPEAHVAAWISSLK